MKNLGFILFCTALLFSKSLYAKNAIVVPGIFANETSAGYNEITSVLEKKGYAVSVLDIDWRHFSFRSYSVQIKEQLSRLSLDDDTLVVGSSIGAFLTLINLSDFYPRDLVLVSPAPFFDDYLSTQNPASWARIATAVFSEENVRHDLKDACRIVNESAARVSIFYAKHDVRANRDLAQLLSQCLDHDQLFYVQGGHGVRSKKTRAAVLRYLTRY